MESTEAIETEPIEIDSAVRSATFPDVGDVEQASTTTSARSDDRDELQPGSVVEVRRRFDRAWARGFEVIDGDGQSFRLRRNSDGAVLPVSFPATDLRLARNVGF